MNTGKLNTMAALAVFMVMLFIYQLTVAPTISFWDSSEFITCAAIMGIPHPPGSPFLSLLSRIMMIIPFPDWIGDDFRFFSTALQRNEPLFNPQLDWGSGGGGFESTRRAVAVTQCTRKGYNFLGTKAVTMLQKR